MSYTHPDYGTGSNKPALDDIYSVLQDLMEEHPKVKQAKLCRLYVDVIINDPDLNRSFVEAFFERVHEQVMRKQAGPQTRNRRTKVQMQDDARKAIADNVFSYLMPNGKDLGDCTCGEVVALGTQFAGLASLAKTGKPQELMAKAFTPKQVRKAWLG
jgi:hypothetical protein